MTPPVTSRTAAAIPEVLMAEDNIVNQRIATGTARARGQASHGRQRQRGMLAVGRNGSMGLMDG